MLVTFAMYLFQACYLNHRFTSAKISVFIIYREGSDSDSNEVQDTEDTAYYLVLDPLVLRGDVCISSCLDPYPRDLPDR